MSKLKFEVEQVTKVKFGDGYIVAHFEKLEKKMNGQDFIMNLWYFKRNYGIADSLVSISISENTVECIGDEITRLIHFGWLVDAVYFAEKSFEEFEEFSMSKMEDTVKE